MSDNDCCNPTPHGSHAPGNYSRCRTSRRNRTLAPASFYIPVSQDSAEDEEVEPFRDYETITTPFEWPSEAATRTFQVSDSAKYSVGACVSVLPNYGWLKIVSIPTATTIEVEPLPSRYNVTPGTGVPAPFNIVIGTCPKPDVQIGDLTDAIEEIVTEQIAESEAAADQSPTFPVDTIPTLESGRLPLWNFDECSEQAERTLGEQLVRTTSSGALAAIKNAGCDSESVNIHKLDPTGSSRGEILVLDRVEACSDDAPNPYSMDPEPISESCEEGLSLLGYREETISCPSGSRIRKLWRKLTKLIFHSGVFFEVTPESDHFELLVSVNNGSCRRIAPLALGENQLIVGVDVGGGTIRNRLRTLEELIPPLEQAFLSTPIQIATTGSGTANLATNGGAFLPDWAHEQFAIVRCKVQVPNDANGGIEINGQLACVASDIANDGPTIGTNIAYAKLTGGTFTYSFLGTTYNTAASIGGFNYNMSEIVLLGYTSAEQLP